MNIPVFRAASRLAAVTLAAFLLLHPTTSFAQLTAQPIVNLGSLGAPVQGMDSGYDPTRGVYLVVSAYINAYGWFVNSAGNIVSGPFLIKQGGGGSFAPRVKYNGQGGFLVTYAEEGPSNQNILHARAISYPNVVGPEMTISEGSAWPWIISGSTALSYSPTSGVFLVAWMTTGPGLPLVARTVGLNGAPLGQIARLSSEVGLYPGVSWNPQTDRFGVSFRDEGAYGYSGFAIVTPSGAVQSVQRFQPVAGQQGATDVDFNPDTGRYVMTWYAQPAGGPWEMRSAEMDTAANVVTSGLLYSKSAGIGFSSLSTAFNPISRTFLGATLETVGGADPVMGFELNRRGVRTSSMTQIGPGVLARNIRVSTSTVSPSWNVAFNHNTQSAVNLVASTSSTGGGPAGEHGSSGPTPTPTPPPPTGGCTSPQPASDWVCVNGNWLPPGMVTPAPSPTPPPPPPPTSSCTTVQPASDWVCVNGNWLPPGMGGTSTTPPPPPPPPSSSTCSSVRPASDWVCYNGDWLPPSLVPQSALPPPPPPPTSGCTTVQPGSDWVCYNGDWIPLAMACPTVQPGPGWTCRNGDWLPPGMVLNRVLDPSLFEMPGLAPKAHAVAVVAMRSFDERSDFRRKA